MGFEIIAEFGRALCQLVRLVDIDRGERRGAGQRIAAEGGAVQARIYLDCRVQQGRPDGHPAAHGFGYAEDVGLQFEMLAGEHFSGTTKTGLDFINDQQGAALAAYFSDRRYVLSLDRIDSALTLYQFEHHRRSVVVNHGVELVDLVVGDVVEPGNQRLEGLTILRCIGGADRTHGAPVETAHRGDEVGASAVQAGKLECRLDRFGAGIAQVGAGQVLRADLYQLFEELGAYIVVHDVGAGNQGLGLLLDCRDQLRVAVAQRSDTDAGGEIEVLAAGLVVQAGAFAAYCNEIAFRL